MTEIVDKRQTKLLPTEYSTLLKLKLELHEPYKTRVSSDVSEG